MRNLAYLDRWRVTLYGTRGDDYNGAFHLRAKPSPVRLWIIASNGAGWDHVSVSCANEQRLPTWREMAWVKDAFFEEYEAVMQLHPPRAQYVNNAEVLHLWRPHEADIPMPAPLLVGLPGASPRDLVRLVAQR